MSNFIKLTSMLINTSKISMIEIQNNKYCIHLVENKLDGFWLFSSGYLTSIQNKQIEVCKEKHPIDYKNLTDWINKDLLILVQSFIYIA